MSSSVEQEKEDQFVQQVVEWSKGEYTSVGLVLASETGVLSAMEKLGKPSTAVDIASAADCKPRYVRELLEKLVVDGVVHLERTSPDSPPLFVIPKYMWKGLKSSALKIMAFLPRLTQSHDTLLECFKTRGPDGLSSSDVTSFTRFIGRDKLEAWEDIISLVFPDLPNMLTNLEMGCRFLEMGCYSGEFIFSLAAKFPKSHFVGYDIDSDLIAKADKSCKAKGLNNVKFMVLDAGNLPADWSETFDVVSAIGVIHDLPYASKACKEAARVLKPGGITFCVDPAAKPTLEERVNNHANQVLYTTSLYHCMSRSLFYPRSEGLGTCIGESALCDLYKASGFSVVKVEDLPFSPELQLSYVCCMKP